ncbi:hypothetical protein YYC_01200 [Plasmodium yoelii 17X]|uniref:Uncharacterized protein n=3 Tax=Plasmodium yoelii TaxID=5861 RepID=A0AAE9X2D6_PLAYO|nr:conserved Plasmodium protein, unknown function [Plasmodium yoelii]ETB61269.1 hypothetical protein YYC_01200 [Plasmodium yoelii 17X]WBY60608.1 hypothetical protein Py17XNL_001400911 [Plasmodium yoelii yoelii]CDU20413.1 conserved Plasmodium protein, unknown function [Plasmodium yoelii]VTZ81373.1 conserved Plasmodium protein, unknown function [Plasmodium yoelii]|eukprot:XP_725339.2 conserved Plasmodium protein, unknown function [Plasmodium yoelii]
MPHHLTSFVAAITGSISSGTCCGCIPFTISPAVTPVIASSTAPLSAAIPNTVIPGAVASQGAVSSSPILTSSMAFIAPFFAPFFASFWDFYKKYNIFEETEECTKVDKMSQCDLTNTQELNCQAQNIEDQKNIFNQNSTYSQNIDNNNNCSTNNTPTENPNIDINEDTIMEEINRKKINPIFYEKSSPASECSHSSFLGDTKI